MLSKMFFSKLFVLSALALAAPIPRIAAGGVCVWKISGVNGATLYLGGSRHAMKSTDSAIPSAYGRALDASSHLVLESSPRDDQEETALFQKTGQYSMGDNLRNHVDPRTYDYLRRIFKIMGVPEERFSKIRPWALVLMLQSPSLHGLSSEFGVEAFLTKRAQTTSKPISGLESARQHMEVFSGLTDRQGEAMLLITFIPQEHGKTNQQLTIDAWRRGDADTMTRLTLESLRDFPAMGDRLLGARNRAWIPKIEGYLRSGQTYFVVAGAAHMGGPDGLLALLQARGYKIEQL
jgi:uncharacterized protein YbaP (TraB family)